MPDRPDHSDSVVHFTGGDSMEQALDTLATILLESRLLGGTGYIRGPYRCVCFTEAPLGALIGRLNPGRAHVRYKPFGVMFRKEWLFDHGGRHVIYGPSSEFDDLPEKFKFRHVRYDPAADVDFSWEREWRIETDELQFGHQDVVAVVPDRLWADQLAQVLWEGQEMRLELERHLYQDLALGGECAYPLHDSRTWRVGTIWGDGETPGWVR